MKHTWKEQPADRPTTATDKRSSERRLMAMPARLAWKDQRGVSRFATVVTHDVSDSGVFVECPLSLSISLYRLVQFQVEPHVRNAHELPDTFRQGRILSAVYRVTHAGKSSPYGLALRLMVEPSYSAVDADASARATA